MVNKRIIVILFLVLAVAAVFFVHNSNKAPIDISKPVIPQRIDLFALNKGGYGLEHGVRCNFARDFGGMKEETGLANTGPDYAYYKSVFATNTEKMTIEAAIMKDRLYAVGQINEETFYHMTDLGNNQVEGSWFNESGWLRADLSENHIGHLSDFSEGFKLVPAHAESVGVCEPVSDTESRTDKQLAKDFIDEVEGFNQSESAKTESFCNVCNTFNVDLVRAQCSVMMGCDILPPVNNQ